MRSFQVFASMSPARAEGFLRTLAEQSPVAFSQAVAAASAAMKARPQYLQKQPFEKRAQAVRRALARVTSNAAAEELLAVYFLECRSEVLIEWLDAVGLEHDEGTLKSDAPDCPPEDALRKAVAKFRKADDSADRETLLHAFAAQSAIDWPVLEALLEPL